MIHYTTATEDCAQSIGSDSDRLMIPMHQIGGGGMSPSHILPFGAVGIILIIEMPAAILIEHSVGIIHPSVERSMMKGGAILLAVGCVKRISQLYRLPASIPLNSPGRCAVVIGNDIKHHLMSFIRGEVERNGIIHLILCEAHIESTLDITVDQKIDTCIIHGFLHGKNQQRSLLHNSYKSVVGAEGLYFHPLGGSGHNG